MKNMENKKSNNKLWSLQELWNEQLTFGRKDKELRPRTHIWASELGKDPYERYLKMTAVKPDFDYDERTLRKFEAGNFFERIIGFVFVCAGILKEDNKWYEIPETKDRLRVTGKPDFVVGGKPDWEKTKKQIDEELLFKLMPNLGRIAEALVNHFAEKYPDGLPDLVYEIKSINSMVFWSKKDYLQEAYPHHRLQLLWELKATKKPEGRLLYISKDDLTVAEFSISADDKKLNELYKIDVWIMSECIRAGKPPTRPDGLIFDQRKKLKFQYLKEKQTIEGSYVENWEIEWSNYISQITGIKNKSKEATVAIWKNSLKDRKKELNDKLKEEFKNKINGGKYKKTVKKMERETAEKNPRLVPY